ncbi:hypothetical protein BB561_000941 [Smittium simulii]|uniref:BAR domain-containing protein n=1 Tax=Smittium simulii TaxID=133385 RepID=A0A2T9YWX8_9FUNG|nr:hypothetical protein BB561_000941 [Smittium simulii]
MDQASQITDENPPSFSSKVGVNLNQFKRMAYEKIGVATDITPLPEDYILLENQVAQFKILISELLKLWKLTVSEDRYSDYTFSMRQSTDPKSSFTDMFWAKKPNRQSFTSDLNTRNRLNSTSSIDFSVKSINENDLAPPLYSSVSSACISAAIDIGLEQPLGNILFKFGSIEQNIGQFKNSMDQTIYNESWPKLTSLLSTKLAEINEACSLVHKYRLALDAARSLYQPKPSVPKTSETDDTLEKNSTDKTSNTSIVDESLTQIDNNSIMPVHDEQAHFYSSINEAIKKMRGLLSSTALYEIILIYTKQQLLFFRESTNILTDLLPEIETAKINHDNFYFSDIINSEPKQQQINSQTFSNSPKLSSPQIQSKQNSESHDSPKQSTSSDLNLAQNELNTTIPSVKIDASDNSTTKSGVNNPETKQKSNLLTKNTQYMDKFLELDDTQSIDLNSDKENSVDFGNISISKLNLQDKPAQDLTNDHKSDKTLVYKKLRKRAQPKPIVETIPPLLNQEEEVAPEISISSVDTIEPETKTPTNFVQDEKTNKEEYTTSENNVRRDSSSEFFEFSDLSTSHDNHTASLSEKTTTK